MIKRLITSTSLMLIIVFCNSTAFADINDEMQNMWDSALTPPAITYTINTPGAFRSQSQYGVFAGGGSMRWPSKTYNITSTQLPSIKGGCAGIDIFLGSFSLISVEKFIEMLKQIMTNAGGLIFQLAIDTISPMIGSVMKTFTDLVQKYGNYSMSSCESAQRLVSGAKGLVQDNMKRACKDQKRSGKNEVDSDIECADDAGTAANAEQDKNPADNCIRCNVVWKALGKVNSGLNDDEKQLIMSLSGTVVFGRPSADGASQIIPWPATISDADAIKQFVLGTEIPTTPNPTTVSLTILTCTNPDIAECLTISPQNTNIKPFAKRVEEMMTAISGKIRGRSTAGLTPSEFAFLNMTSTVPVWKMLSVANAKAGLADDLIYSYKEVIAADYAETFLSRTLAAAHQVMAASPAATTAEREAVKEVLNNIRHAVSIIRQEKANLMKQQQGALEITQSIMDVERKIYGNLPHQLQATLKYSGHAVPK